MTTVPTTRPFSMRLCTTPLPRRHSPDRPIGTDYDESAQLTMTPSGDPWVRYAGGNESCTYVNDDGRETDYTDPY